MTVGVLVLSVALWFIPSRVVELIAEHRHVLLGRYSVAWFSVLLLLTLVLWVVSYALWASIELSNRDVGFRIAAVVLSVAIAVVAADVVGRFFRTPRYIERRVQSPKDWPGERVPGIVRHRPPNRLYQIEYADVPATARSYPDAPPGHPNVKITLQTDARGYRNLTSLEQCDIVTVGDSFTEGSRVSDKECWPALLGKRLKCRVYNLGISGGRPSYYLNVFKAFGLGLTTKTANFMVYEGNDFKGVRFVKGEPSDTEPAGDRIIEYIKASPVVLGLKHAFIKYLGPINANGPVRDAGTISWMPVALASEGDSKYYAFTPSRLMRLDWAEADFQRSQEWTSTARVFKMIKKVCDEQGIRLVFAYAPSKPHVIMPLAWDRIPPKKLHIFASFKKRQLPPPDVLKQRLINSLTSQENVMSEFCRDEAIEFVSATEALQKGAEEGRQVYYTYDQHWTCVGHAIVAQAVYRFLTDPGTGRPVCGPAGHSPQES